LRALQPHLLILFGLTACASPPPSAAQDSAPYALVLGTAQDGGLPQIACDGPQCHAARANPDLGRLVASLLVVDPASGKRWLIDATPDLPAQVELAREHGAPRGAGRPALFDGIFVTHAHTGHYGGLLHLGREAYGGAPVPVHGPARLTTFLENNGPWELSVKLGHLAPTTLAPGVPFALTDELTITALLVPHRDEYSETYAYVVRGPERALVYLPDIDKWERWEQSIEAVIADVDVALLDGTFHADGEIPGRAMADIPHPFLAESIARFAALPESERQKIRFTHLNHTNPASNPRSAAAAAVRAAGMAIAADGERHGL